MFKLVANFQRKFFNRSVMYASAIFMIYLFQAGYIILLVVLAQQPIPEPAHYFSLTAFINAVVFTLLFYNAINKGADANATDANILRAITELRMSVNGEIGNLIQTGEYYRVAPDADPALQAMVQQRANNAFWMKETEQEGILRDMNTNICYEAKNFAKIDADELNDLRDPLLEVLDNFLEEINFHSENNQYQALGQPMNADQADNLITNFFSILVAFAQQLLFPSS